MGHLCPACVSSLGGKPPLRAENRATRGRGGRPPIDAISFRSSAWLRSAGLDRPPCRRREAEGLSSPFLSFLALAATRRRCRGRQIRRGGDGRTAVNSVAAVKRAASSSPLSSGRAVARSPPWPPLPSAGGWRAAGSRRSLSRATSVRGGPVALPGPVCVCGGV